MKFHCHLRISFILVFVLFPVKSGSAEIIYLTDESRLINSFFKNLYNFSFHKADSIVLALKDSKSDNITFSIIKANLSWWKLLSGDEIDTNLRVCNSIIDESIRLSLIDSDHDINSQLNIIYLYSLKARLENYKGNTLKSFINFFKAITYIQEIIQSPVKDEKMNLILGLYYYSVDYIENKSFIFNAVLLPFPKGDREKGLMYLERCSLSGDEMIKTEANYFLMKIYFYTEKDYPKAYLNSKVLTLQHPNNLVYSLEQLKLLLKMEKNEEAELFQKKLLNEIQNAKYINTSQKTHFISLIGDITSSGVK